MEYPQLKELINKLSIYKDTKIEKDVHKSFHKKLIDIEKSYMEINEVYYDNEGDFFETIKVNIVQSHLKYYFSVY